MKVRPPPRDPPPEVLAELASREDAAPGATAIVDARDGSRWYYRRSGGTWAYVNRSEPAGVEPGAPPPKSADPNVFDRILEKALETRESEAPAPTEGDARRAVDVDLGGGERRGRVVGVSADSLGSASVDVGLDHRADALPHASAAAAARIRDRLRKMGLGGAQPAP